MTNTYDFGTENQARAFWHHLLDQMGLDRLIAQCSIKVFNGLFRVTVTH